MKIQQMPKYLWSKYPYQSIAGATLLAATILIILIVLSVFPLNFLAFLMVIAAAGIVVAQTRRDVHFPFILKSLNPAEQIEAVLKENLFELRGKNDWDIINIIIKNETITPEQKFTLFSYKKNNSPLLREFQNPENIRTLLSIKGMTPEHKFQLLSQQDYEGNNLFKLGAKEVITVILDTPGLTTEQKFKLIAQTNGKGENSIASNLLSPEKVKILLNVPEMTIEQKFALLTCTSDYGDTVLSRALHHGGTIGIETTTLILNIDNMSIEQKLYLLYQNQNKALFEAIDKNQNGILPLILNFKKDMTLEQQVTLESTILLRAAQMGNMPVFESILKNKSPDECFILLSVKNKEGYTPLLQATQNNHLNMVNTILNRVPKEKLPLIRDVADPDNVKQTAIYFADRKGRSEIRNLLQDNGAILPTRTPIKPK